MKSFFMSFLTFQFKQLARSFSHWFHEKGLRALIRPILYMFSWLVSGFSSLPSRMTQDYCLTIMLYNCYRSIIIMKSISSGIVELLSRWVVAMDGVWCVKRKAKREAKEQKRAMNSNYTKWLSLPPWNWYHARRLRRKQAVFYRFLINKLPFPCVLIFL